MRILFLAPEPVVSTRQGTTLRIEGLARELARRHSVSLLAFGEAPQARVAWLDGYVAVPRARRSALSRLVALSRSGADLEGRARSELFSAALSRWLEAERFDAVFVEGLEMTPYVEIAAGAVPRPLVVYDAHNAEHVLQRRAFETDRRRLAGLPGALYSWVQWRRLRERETEVCRSSDLVVCTSEADRDALGAENAVVVPNGVHAGELAFEVPSSRSGEQIVFVGKMDYRPNRDAARWFCREIFPRVVAERPRARFLVVGRDPARSVRALDRLPGVSVTGTVEDAHRYFREAAVAVVPLRMGSGTRLKILEAMALGTPNVATRIGAEGLDVSPGRDLLLADTEEEIAKAVLGLLSEPERAGAISRAARRLVVDRYDWPRLVEPLEAALAARS